MLSEETNSKKFLETGVYERFVMSTWKENSKIPQDIDLASAVLKYGAEVAYT